jgi:hypothetical protein
MMLSRAVANAVWYGGNPDASLPIASPSLLPGLHLNLEGGGRYVHPKLWASSELYGITTQNTLFFKEGLVLCI